MTDWPDRRILDLFGIEQAVLLAPMAGFGTPELAIAVAEAGGLGALSSPRVVALAVGVGVLSSVVPYAIDQVVLRRLGRARFAVLLALLPMTATLIGFVALGQVPGPLESVGIVAVVVAVALRSRDGDEPAVAAARTPS